MRWNQITDAGASAALAALQMNDVVTDINIRWNCVSEGVAAELRGLLAQDRYHLRAQYLEARRVALEALALQNAPAEADGEEQQPPLDPLLVLQEGLGCVGAVVVESGRWPPQKGPFHEGHLEIWGWWDSTAIGRQPTPVCHTNPQQSMSGPCQGHTGGLGVGGGGSVWRTAHVA